MNKQELIDLVSEKVESSKANVSKILDAILNTIVAEVAEGHVVQFIKFGSYSKGKRAPRMGRNPKTGEPIEIAGTSTVKFTPGKAFKDAVNAKN